MTAGRLKRLSYLLPCAWVSLAFGGCFSSDLDQFQVVSTTNNSAVDEGDEPEDGALTIAGVTHAAYMNAATEGSFTLGGTCDEESCGIIVQLSDDGSIPDVPTTCL